MEININNIIPILKEAGDVILDIYNNQETKVDYKLDESPLTQADTAANEIIVKYLSENFSYPIISEEGEQTPYEDRKNYNTFWLVDPLDGTKEFINRNGEFTVNIALIENGSPIFGGIYVPVKDTYYFGDRHTGAYKKVGQGELTPLKANDNSNNWIAVGSKSHAKEEEKTFYSSIGVKESISVGSSLKFCMVAEGSADIYFRSGPTMEWDIAAGHAIVNAAGGEVYQDLGASQPFKYNKEDLLNGPFLCTSNRKFITE